MTAIKPRIYSNRLTRALLSVAFLGGLHLVFAGIPGLTPIPQPGAGSVNIPGIAPAPTIDPATGRPVNGIGTVPLPGLPTGGVSTNQAPQVNNGALLAEAMAVVQKTTKEIKAEANGSFTDDVNLQYARMFGVHAKWGKKIRQTRQKHNLGVLYTKGIGVPLDFLSAYKLFKEAADEGLPQSQLNVGIALQSGMGAKKDFVGAYKYYTLAAAQGLPTAAMARDNLAQFLTRFQIQAGQRMANGFMKRHHAKLKYIEKRKAAASELLEKTGRRPTDAD
jgi:hypothetical protein